VATYSKLTHALCGVPRGRRGAILQLLAGNRAEQIKDEPFDLEEMSDALHETWESRYSQPYPVDTLQEILDPPVAIGQVLEFNKLMLVETDDQLDEAVANLRDCLYARVTERLARTTQLPLFEEGMDSNTESSVPESATGETVDDLETLVAMGRHYSTIYADPPWSYDNTSSRGAAENHYRTMSVEEIRSEPVASLAADYAHLHLWTTNGFLQEALDVIDAWGFRFKSCFVWAKPEIGMGNYWRVSHEFLLLGVRGSLTFRDNSVRSWIESHRGPHSRKPAVIRSLIERVSPGPYLELYGREKLPDSQWTVYGNQIETRLF